ncbi:hypothetical protein ACFU6K_19625 [Kitasatospora sp. NPDC057512]|uniref:hypothetical protein n=1 Tax=Kitasatospora sp. NPDC057512 TaxID=3346154 RepID=UPI00369FD474
MDEVMSVLRQEFDAEEGSFLLRLRGELEWDRAAFTRLERARAACKQLQEEQKLDRWIAEGFYELATWVPSWTSHPNFPRPVPDSYYEDCIERLGDLADWFFRGWHDRSEGDSWVDL